MSAGSGQRIRWAAFVVVAFLVQVALLAQVRLWGVHPESMMLVAIVAGVVGGSHRGAVIGFAAGLLVDLTLHGTLGVVAFCYTVVGFVVGLAAEALPGMSRLATVLIAFVASAVGVVLYATVDELLGANTFSDPGFVSIVAIVAIWNAILSVPFLAVGRRAEGRRVAF